MKYTKAQLKKDRTYNSSGSISRNDIHGRNVSVGYRGHGNMIYLWLTDDAMDAIGATKKVKENHPYANYVIIKVNGEPLSNLCEVIDKAINDQIDALILDCVGCGGSGQDESVGFPKHCIHCGGKGTVKCVGSSWR